jgi:hypothetical protein
MLKNTSNIDLEAMCYLLGSMTEGLKECATRKPSNNINKIVETVHKESLVALQVRLWFAGNIFIINIRNLYIL